MKDDPRIRVLVVDDSAIVRKLLSQTLSGESDIEVVGVAPDAIIAEEKIHRLDPDVLTLDIEMPRMDGLTFLKKLMQSHPMPVVVISSLGQASSRTAVEAMQYGAVEVLAKPGGPYSVGDLKNDLPQRIRAAARAKRSFARRPAAKPAEAPAQPPHPPAAAPKPGIELLRRAGHGQEIILIGASTGGTEAIREVLVRMPVDAPPVVIVQHIPAVFSRAFAERLDSLCRMHVKEASAGDRLARGLALVAPGNHHLILRRDASGYHVMLDEGPPVCYQRPSVDVMFHSAVPFAGPKWTAALLTGMGADGAQGLLHLRQAGVHTIAQNEDTCVVFGMPREAIRLGGAGRVLPLDRIAEALLAAAPVNTRPQ